jgi:hypothetical protein
MPGPPEEEVPGWVYGLLGILLIAAIICGASGHMPHFK